MTEKTENNFENIEDILKQERCFEDREGDSIFVREQVKDFGCESHDCKMSVPKYYSDDRKTKRKGKNKNTEYQKMLDRHKEKLYANCYGDDEIRETIGFKDEQIIQFAYYDINGNPRTIDSYTKGSTSYHWKNSARIKKKAKEFLGFFPEVLFITFTCDPKKHENNKGKAWKKWKRELDKTIDAMRKKTDMKYICVLEATNNIYPHAHIMAFFPKGTFKEYDKLPFKKKIVFGEVRRFTEHYAKEQIYDVQKPKGDEVVNYMVKYISKSTSEMVGKECKNKGNLSKKVRKATASWECPSMFHFKQMRMSLSIKRDGLELYKYFEEKTEAEKESKEYVKLHFALMDREEFERICREQGLSEKSVEQLKAECANSAAARRRYLIYLCINSECFRTKDVRGVKNKDFRRLFEKEVKLLKGEKPNKFDLIMKNCHKDVCSGCLYNDIGDIVLGNLDNHLNIMWYYCEDGSENGEEKFILKKKRFITEKDFLNDAVFMAKLAMIDGDYYKYKLGGGRSYVKFKENYIERQLYIKKALDFNYLPRRIPEHWKNYCEEERQSAIKALDSMFTDLDFDFCDSNAATFEYIEKEVRPVGLKQIVFA